MVLKRNKLEVNFDFDYQLLGIVSQAKEFKLAWSINCATGINFVKQPDLKIELKNEKRMQISWFRFSVGEQTFELIQNKLLEENKMIRSYLIPEIKQFNFILKFQDKTGDFSIKMWIDRLREIPCIEYLVFLDFDQLKSKDNLIF